MKNPQEGYDYLINLYSLIGITADAEPEAIDEQLAQREAAATSAQGTIGELLGRARRVLTNPILRAAYNELLGEWTGPISSDGSPVITVAEHARHLYADIPPHLVEIDVKELEHRTAQSVGYNPGRIDFLKQLVGPDTTDPFLLHEYDTALFDKDRVLGAVEQRRAELLGITSGKLWQTSVRPGHRQRVAQSIAEAQAAADSRHRLLMAGNFISRIMSLYGNMEPAIYDNPLPAYFDSQARELARVAQYRESILGQRLAVYHPTYLNRGMHFSPPQHLIAVNAENRKLMCFTSGSNGRQPMVSQRIPAVITQDMHAPLAADGYEVIRIDPRPQISEDLLAAEALRKYDKYRPLPVATPGRA